MATDVQWTISNHLRLFAVWPSEAGSRGGHGLGCFRLAQSASFVESFESSASLPPCIDIHHIQSCLFLAIWATTPSRLVARFSAEAPTTTRLNRNLSSSSSSSSPLCLASRNPRNHPPPLSSAHPPSKTSNSNNPPRLCLALRLNNSNSNSNHNNNNSSPAACLANSNRSNLRTRACSASLCMVSNHRNRLVICLPDPQTIRISNNRKPPCSAASRTTQTL